MCILQYLKDIHLPYTVCHKYVSAPLTGARSTQSLLSAYNSSSYFRPTVLIRGRSLLSAALVWRRGEPTDAGALICPRFLVVSLRSRETTGGSDGSLGGAGVFFDFSPLSSTSSSGWDGGSSYSSSTLVSDPKPWKGGESGPVSMNF